MMNKAISTYKSPASKLIKLGCVVALAATTTIANALTFPLPPRGTDVVGKLQYARAKGGETLADVGRRYDVGIVEMMVANPGMPAYRHLRRGKKLLIPTRFILPPGLRRGIVINLAEHRLYYYPKGQNVVVTEPVGIGRQGEWKTPLGVTTVVSKEKDPVWRPTAAVRAEAARNGTPIPRVFPPGKDNPLGRYVLRLGWPTYLIHGTNRPRGVGSRVSAGCIRMFNDDIRRLFHKVPIGTQVRVINQPIKSGWANGKLYLEAHRPLTEVKSRRFRPKLNMSQVAPVVKAEAAGRLPIKWRAVQNAIRHMNGWPTPVAYR